MKRKSLRILVIWDNIIGVELSANYRISQLAELARRGHTVTWVTATNSKVMVNHGVPTFSLQTLLLRKVVPGLSFLLFQLFALRRLIGLLNRSDAVILEVRTLPALFPFLMIRRLGSQSPALLLRVSTNTIGPPGHLRTFFNQFVETLSIKLSAKFFDRIFFISPMMAQFYSAWYGIPKSKIAVWPSAVDTSVFKQPSKASVDRLREEIGLSDRG